MSCFQLCLHAIDSNDPPALKWPYAACLH